MDTTRAYSVKKIHYSLLIEKNFRCFTFVFVIFPVMLNVTRREAFYVVQKLLN